MTKVNFVQPERELTYCMTFAYPEIDQIRILEIQNGLCGTLLPRFGNPIYIEVPFQGRSMLVPADVAEQPYYDCRIAPGVSKSLHPTFQMCMREN